QDGDDQKRNRGADGDGGLEDTFAIVEEQEQRSRHHRQHDRRDDEMLRSENQRSGSLPSTWSVPVKPRAASSTTRKSAVVAKPITIAVRTRACGSGSAKLAGSMASVPGRTGAALVLSLPIEKMNRLTA